MSRSGTEGGVSASNHLSVVLSVFLKTTKVQRPVCTVFIFSTLLFSWTFRFSLRFFFKNTFSSFSHGVCTAEISRLQLLQAFRMGKGKWGGPEGEGAPRHPVSFSPLFSGPPITILSPICHQHHHTVAHTDSTVDRQDSFRFRAACKLVFLVFVFLFISLLQDSNNRITYYCSVTYMHTTALVSRFHSQLKKIIINAHIHYW